MVKCFEHHSNESSRYRDRKMLSNTNQRTGPQKHHTRSPLANTIRKGESSPGQLYPRTKLISQLQSSSASTEARSVSRRSRVLPADGDDAVGSSQPVNLQMTHHLDTATLSREATSTARKKLPSAADEYRVSPRIREALRPENVDQEIPKTEKSRMTNNAKPWKHPLVFPKSGKRQTVVDWADMFRLDSDEFLNDNLIGFFLRYLEDSLEQRDPKLADRIYFYNSFFYERLVPTSKRKKPIDYESVEKWTRKTDIFDRNFVVVPVNENYHWYAVIIYNLPKLNPGNKTTSMDIGGGDQDETDRAQHHAVSPKMTAQEPKRMAGRSEHEAGTEQTTRSLSQLSLTREDEDRDELAISQSPSTPKKSKAGRAKSARRSLPRYDLSTPVIMTLDPLGLPRSSTCTALRQYIVEEARQKKGWEIDGTQIRGMTAKGIPVQSNYSDCGLYVCAYMEKFVTDPQRFAARILRREMRQDRDIPVMASHELRDRMRGLILELHHKQEQKLMTSDIPVAGTILLAAPSRPLSPRQPISEHHAFEDSQDELQKDFTSTNRTDTGEIAIDEVGDNDIPAGRDKVAAESSLHGLYGSARLKELAPGDVQNERIPQETRVVDMQRSDGRSKFQAYALESAGTVNSGEEHVKDEHVDASSCHHSKERETDNPDVLSKAEPLPFRIHQDDSGDERATEGRNDRGVHPSAGNKHYPGRFLKRSHNTRSTESMDADHLVSGRSYQSSLPQLIEQNRPQTRADHAIMIPDSQESVGGQITGQGGGGRQDEKHKAEDASNQSSREVEKGRRRKRESGEERNVAASTTASHLQLRNSSSDGDILDGI